MRINLNEILARDDYKRMTENLKSITEEVNAKIYGATKKEALAFLNASKKLILGLGELEQHQVEEIQKVLDERKKQ